MRRAIWFLIATTIAVGALLAVDAVPALRGDLASLHLLPKEAVWIWLSKIPRLGALLLCIAGVAVYVIGAWRLLQQGRSQSVILWAYCGAVLLPLVLMSLDMRPLDYLLTRSISLVSSDYHDAAFAISDLGQTLNHWTDFMQNYYALHHTGGITLSPPGLLVIYSGVSRVLETAPAFSDSMADLFRQTQCHDFSAASWSSVQWASLLIQVSMPIWAALAVAPIYRLGVVALNRQAARAGVLLYPLIPGILVFLPRFNVAYILLSAVALALLWSGMERWLLRPAGASPRRGLLWIGLAGFVIGVGTFLNISLVPLGLLVVVSLVICGWRFPLRLIGALLVFGIGSTVIWLIYSGLTGITPFMIVQTAFEFHYLLNRPYFPWLFLHTYDMFFWIGLPVAILCLWHGWRSKFGLAALISLLILVLSGTARGETGRVWLWLAPCWLLMAGASLARLRVREQHGVIAAQAVMLVILAAVLNANFSEFYPPVKPSEPTDSSMFALNTQFTQSLDSVTLLGVSAESGTIRLYWRSDERYVRNPYIISVLPVDNKGTVGKSVDYVPGGWEHPYPPACWVPGEVVSSSVPLKLTAGDWSFSVRVENYKTGVPMSVSSDTQAGLGPIHIP